MSKTVKKHFDTIAAKYDYFKKKNWYYYKNLKSLYRQLIPKGKAVLEIGCGTGDLISGLDAGLAIGIDISPEMIKIARKKYPIGQFKVAAIEDFVTQDVFEYIFLADVIEHLENIPSTIKAIAKRCNNKTKVIFTYANPIWEPILMFLEKLSLKMPEGPHYRIPYFKLKKILAKNGFVTIERNWRLLIPANIPFLSNFINVSFYRVPLLRRLGMLEYIIIKKK
jgi:ubiquinone/menaquinone biosynthesis C-methylase UbiE